LLQPATAARRAKSQERPHPAAERLPSACVRIAAAPMPSKFCQTMYVHIKFSERMTISLEVAQ